MALIRGTFFFSDSNGAGWSETIYNTAANLTDALAKGNRLVPLRVALLGVNSFLNEVRFSDDLVKRDSQIIIVPPGDKASLRSANSAFASLDVVCRIEGQNLVGPPFTVRRTLALRGVPTTVLGIAGVFAPQNAPAWSNNLNSFTAQLISDQWAIRYRDKTVLQYALQSLTQNVTTGVVTVVTQLPFTVAPGQTVSISGTVGSVEANGLWNVLSYTAPNQFTILLHQLMRPYLGGGVTNLNPYALAVITKLIPIRTNTHRAGRPLGELRGRRRARARR